VPTIEEILKVVDRLDSQFADDLETEELEFKPWRSNVRENQSVAAEYAVCLGNARGGTIVFGVEDKAIGRERAIHGCRGYQLDLFKNAVFQATTPCIRVQLEELVLPEGVLLLVHVPAAPPNTTYGTVEGLYKIRVGKSCRGLPPHEHQRQRMSIGVIDWSAEPVEGMSFDDLDHLEIERYRNTLRLQKPTSDLLQLSHRDLLMAIRALEDNRVCNAALLVFGRKEVIKRVLPQHEVIFIAHASPTEIFKENFQSSILAILERLTELLFLPTYNPVRALEVDLFKFDIQKFPTETLRESLLNAVIHRDYTEQGPVYVRLEGDELSFTNPGGFIGGITPQNILTHEARQRNRRLAETIEKSELVERAGMGRRRIFIPMLAFGKRMPTYVADAHSVSLRLYGGVVNENLAGLVARLQKEGFVFGINELAVLNYLVVRESIDVGEASVLLQVDQSFSRNILDDLVASPIQMLEKRGRKKGVTYHLAPPIAVELLGKSRYARMKDIDAIRFPEMIRQWVEQHGSINNRECRELLRLGNSASASVKASQTLSQLSGAAGFLKPVGMSKAKRRYVLK